MSTESVAQAVAAVRAQLPLTTQRVTLREVRAADVPAVHAYRSDPRVTRYLGHPALDREAVAELVTGWQGEQTAVSLVADVRPRYDGPERGVVGDVRVRLRTAAALAPSTTTAVDAALGYAFHARVRGHGLATESVGAVLRALSAAGVRRVTARVFAPAEPSRRLLGRLGFTLDGIDRAAVLAPDGTTWWDDELWSWLPDRDRAPGTTPAGR